MADITADWRLHMPFDAWPTQVVETPSRVYFISRTFEFNKDVEKRMVSSNSLFYYDKAGDEIVPVNEGFQASDNAVASIHYNAVDKYLLVVYTDCNIDFFYEDGRIINLPALMVANVAGRKEASYITFDHPRHRVYIATSFGYVALDDVKHEVAESRNYGTELESVARCGDNIVICVEGNVLLAPADSQRFNLSDYTPIENAPVISYIVPTAGSHFYGYTKFAESYLGCFRPTPEGYEWEWLTDDPKFFGIQEVEGGYRLTGNVRLFFIDYNREKVTDVNRPEPEYRIPAATFDGKNLWTLKDRKGLRKYKSENQRWVLAKDYMRPNAPATYIATSFAYNPPYGMLAGSNGYDIALADFNQSTPANVSALKNNFWKEFGPAYSGNANFENLNKYTGIGVDPKKPSHIYRSSTTGGLLRINLDKPDDILVMANKSHPLAGKPGFIQVAEDQLSWDRLCRFTTPEFDANGTMWTLYNNKNMDRGELWYWTATDRLATTSPSTYRPMKSIPLKSFTAGNNDNMIVLKNTKNVVAIGGKADSGTILFYNHNGTPDVIADDRYVHLTRLYDQDGGSVEFLAVNALFEDPETGLVWILSQRGLFTVSPSAAFEDPTRVNRIKVARNDGTNLADYLLNEINVNHLSIDAERRKWFSTSNGLVCTSADGRSILGEFTTDNSLLPDNNVYATCYNPANNSILVATEGGIVEMYPSGSGGVADNNTVRVFPNPVEPDYFGWVRIDNLSDGSLVKITDSQGGVVKELGPAQGGSVEWDVSGLNNTRVSSGVYYIMVSPGASGEGKAQISKILVLN